MTPAERPTQEVAPRTSAGRDWLAKRHRGQPTSEDGIAFREADRLAILAIEAEASRSTPPTREVTPGTNSCPVCGHAVAVVGDPNEGTMHYEPIEAEAAPPAAVTALRAAVGALLDAAELRNTEAPEGGEISGWQPVKDQDLWLAVRAALDKITPAQPSASSEGDGPIYTQEDLERAVQDALDEAAMGEDL